MVRRNVETLVLLSDHGTAELTDEIYFYLNKKLTKHYLEPFKQKHLHINRFKDGEPDIRVDVNVRERNVYVIKSFNALAERCNEERKEKPKLKFDQAKGYEELFVINDALKRASAREICNVTPYIPYLRQDRKDQPRRPITAKRYAQLTEDSGAKRILTIEPHFKQLQGFYEIPVDDLKSSIIFAEYIENYFAKDLNKFIVASPDLGGGERAEDLAKHLKLPLIVDYKRRNPVTGEIELKGILKISDVDLKGKRAILFDDIIDSGGSIIKAAANLRAEGVEKVYACCAHPVFSENAAEKLGKEGIEVIVTNSILLDKEYPNVKVLSLGRILSEAIYGIYTGKGISKHLFDYKNYKRLIKK
ncbi:ribose-phosphate diphosphokinase [Candidatus Woesearchaeota archaeon]|nr:ribose-phosphate diphosphokinase [Candidatus Woesearchaeota archaeon]